MRFLIPISYLTLRLVLTNTTPSDSPNSFPPRNAWMRWTANDTGKSRTAESLATNRFSLWQPNTAFGVDSPEEIADTFRTHSQEPQIQNLAPSYRTRLETAQDTGIFILRQQYPGRSAQLEVTDVFGKPLWSALWRSQTLRLDLSGQPKGIYFVKLLFADHRQEILRVNSN